MTRAPTHNKRSIVALTIGAVMLFSTIAPFASVAADNEAGDPDGLVVVLTPRFATAMNGGVAMAASDNAFIFDFELFDADGRPFLVTEYAIDVHTIDGRLDPPADWPTLVWTDTFTTAATNKGTFLIPATDAIFFTPDDPNGYDHELPFGGMSVVFLATKGGAGQSLLSSTGHYPAGNYNIATKTLVANGHFEEADQADEGFTPMFLFNGQLSGLVQFGNPFLNPGFEIGWDDAQGDLSQTPCACPFTSGIPPWVMLTVNGELPASNHWIQGAAGSSGSAVTIDYDPADNPRQPFYGQLFFVPGADESAAYFGTSSVKVEYDIMVTDSSGLIPSYHGAATLHWNDSTQADGESEITRMPPGGIPTDGVWRHIVQDWGAAANGKKLNSFFFSFNLAAPAGSDLRVTIDNVRLTGATVKDAVNPRNDGTDGYANFITPSGLVLNGNHIGAGEHATQVLTQFADGTTGYLFKLGAVDYLGNDPVAVDVPNAPYSVFKILDQRFIESYINGCHAGCIDESDVAFMAVSNGVNADSFYTLSGGSDESFMVVPAAGVSGIRAVPWLFVDIETGDTYANTFGSASEPSNGFFSVARNNLMLTHLADSMDYAFNPIQFSSAVGASLAYPTTATIDCPAMTPTTACAAAADPELLVTVDTTSPIDETLTVELVSAALGTVLASGTVDTPSDSLTLVVSAADKAAMTTAGNLQVFARVLPGKFAAGQQSAMFSLDNFRPQAVLTNSSLDDLLTQVNTRFGSASTDSDGTIVQTVFEIEYLSDPTDDADPATNGLTRTFNHPADSGPREVVFTIPDDGNFRATLTVTDNGGATDSVFRDFSAGNRAPTVTLSTPHFGMLNTPISFVRTVADPDGLIKKITVDLGNGTTVVLDNLAIVGSTQSFVSLFDTPGTKTVVVTVEDDDAVSSSTSVTVLIDGEVPTTTVTVPPAPTETDGWFSGPVTFTVARADTGGSGVHSSTIMIDGGNEVVSGDADVSRTIVSDGIHTISAYTLDKAGNTDAATATVHTVKIDTSKPVAAVVSPAPVLEGAPIAGVFLTDTQVPVVVSADDEQSPITQVQFFVDGGPARATVTTPDADGNYSWNWLAAGTGFHTISAVATNAVGLTTLTESVTILVI